MTVGVLAIIFLSIIAIVLAVIEVIIVSCRALSIGNYVFRRIGHHVGSLTGASVTTAHAQAGLDSTFCNSAYPGSAGSRPEIAVRRRSSERLGQSGSASSSRARQPVPSR